MSIEVTSATARATQDAIIWDERTQGVGKLITNFATGLADQTSAQHQELKALLDILPKLQTAMVEKFRSGFESGGFARSDEFPPNYVYDQILSQVATDFNAIVQIEGQRRRVDGFGNDHLERATLARADKLTQAALEPARSAGWIPTMAWPICYYQKSASIRLIPYRDVAFIALPYSAMQVPRDFLAIPHEVGHYLYWRGKLNGSSIRTALRTEFGSADEEVKNWLEEIFADVYGAWLAGPAIALSFQDLQQNSTKFEFMSDDDVHPTPILRPMIYAKVIERYFPAWAGAVKARWQTIVADRVAPPDRPQANSHIAKVTLGAPGNTPLDQVVNSILDKLDALTQNGIWKTYLPETPPTDATASTIYAAFGNTINDPTVVDQTVFTPAAAVAPPADATPFINLWESDPPEPGEPTWMPLLRAGGWTSKGPHGRH